MFDIDYSDIEDASDEEMLRQSIRAEMDAISMYEKMADSTDDARLDGLFRHIANEEKEHVGEFYHVLEIKDEIQFDMRLDAIEDVHNKFRNTFDPVNDLIDSLKDRFL